MLLDDLTPRTAAGMKPLAFRRRLTLRQRHLCTGGTEEI
jgi:hypothetical protein